MSANVFYLDHSVVVATYPVALDPSVAQYVVSGTVISEETGAPLAATVRAFRRSDAQLMAETTSSAVDGSYTLAIIGTDPVDVTAFVAGDNSLKPEALGLISP